MEMLFSIHKVVVATARQNQQVQSTRSKPLNNFSRILPDSNPLFQSSRPLNATATVSLGIALSSAMRGLSSPTDIRRIRRGEMT
jgi:hypothetical protein